VQSPLISFVSVSSPMYWPSNLAEACAHALLPSPAQNKRHSPSHLGVPFFPFRLRFEATTDKAPSPGAMFDV